MEHVHALDERISSGITLEGLNLRCACASYTRGAGGRQCRRAKQCGERTLEVSPNDCVEGLVVPRHVVDGLEQALHGCVGQCGCIRSRHNRVGRRNERRRSRARADIQPSADVVAADPCLDTSSEVRNRAIVCLTKLVGCERRFHRTLEGHDCFGNVVAQLIADSSNVCNVLRELGHTNGLTEDLRVVREFFAVANNVVAVRTDIRAVNDTTDGRARVGVCLPAEVHVSRLGAFACHRRERGVPCVNERNHVHEVFAFTATG